MIDVIASIRVRPGCRDEFLRIFKANAPNVLAEDGCIRYQPTVDAPSGIATQQSEPNTVTIVERWESLDALHAHLKAPHMAAYRETVKDLVDRVDLKVLEAA